MKLGLIPVTVAVLLICTVALLTTTVWVYPASQGKSLHRRTESHDVRRQATSPLWLHLLMLLHHEVLLP